MQEDKDDLHVHRSGRLTILELMSALAILGILLTWVLRRFMTM